MNISAVVHTWYKQMGDHTKSSNASIGRRLSCEGEIIVFIILQIITKFEAKIQNNSVYNICNILYSQFLEFLTSFYISQVLKIYFQGI